MNGLLTYRRRLKCGRQLRRELPPLLEQIRSASNRDDGGLDGPEEAARQKAEAAAEAEAMAEANETLTKALAEATSPEALLAAAAVRKVDADDQDLRMS